MSWLEKYDKEDYYLTEEGYLVFTEIYHRKRGHCCQSNCRHCPWKIKKNNLAKSSSQIENIQKSEE